MTLIKPYDIPLKSFINWRPPQHELLQVDCIKKEEQNQNADAVDTISHSKILETLVHS